MRTANPQEPNHRSKGGGEGSRTLDLSIANAALSQLSYAPTSEVRLNLPQGFGYGKPRWQYYS